MYLLTRFYIFFSSKQKKNSFRKYKNTEFTEKNYLFIYKKYKGVQKFIV